MKRKTITAKAEEYMKQRYNDMSHGLAWMAAYSFFNKKWSRTDVLAFVEEWSGIPRRELYQSELTQDFKVKLEVIENIACFIEDMVDDICSGRELDCIDPVTIHSRADGMTGKMRDIANLCIPHQLLGHLVKLALDPLFKARLLPTQHASIPGRGQTGLVKQTQKYFNKKSLGIRFVQKIDAVHAYASTMYADVIRIVRKEIPCAKWIVKVLEYLGELAPGGHLIIGGYIDAWLFNFVISYGMKYALEQGSTRRGQFRRHVSRIESYMDDCGFMGRTKTGVSKGISAFAKWMKTNMNISIRITTYMTEIPSVEQEKARKKLEKPSQRGCPCLDMGGYRICRTHITIRPRCLKRIIRDMTRAWCEMLTTGTIRRDRAQSLVSRYGSIKNSDSANFAKKYHVAEIVNMAKRICSFWSRERTRRRKAFLERWLSSTTMLRMYSYG